MQLSKIAIKKSVVCRFTVFILILLLQTVSAYGWGKTGHRLIARIAEAELSPATSRAISQILGKKSIVSVSLWADAIKKKRPETGKFHYCDFPKSSNEEQSIESDTSQENVISTLSSFLEVLQNPQASKRKKREALKFVVHLVGDIHQPMHCNPKGDAGGNLIKVTFNEIPTNLHRLWDSDLLEFTGISEEDYFAKLISNFHAQENSTLQTGNPMSWAGESCHLAMSHAYKLPDGLKLDEQYYFSNSAVIDRRLVQAGLRLARVLEASFQQVNSNDVAVNFRRNTSVLESVQ